MIKDKNATPNTLQYALMKTIMSRWLLYFIYFLIPICINGQDNRTKTKDHILFDKAMDYYSDEIYDSAINMFDQIIDSFPQSELKGRAEYNVGYINFQIKNYEKSKSVFIDILKQNFNEFEPNGLMEQYTLFKHRSCESLAEIYIIEENYQDALKYVKLFDKKYPYKHFCGNELSAYNMYRARCYARVFEGEKSYDKAFKQLLPYIFDDGLANNNSLLSDLKRIAAKAYSKEILMLESQKAFNSLKIKRDKYDEYGIITFFNVKVKVYDASLFALDNQEYKENIELAGYDKFKKVILTNEFFKEYLK